MNDANNFDTELEELLTELLDGSLNPEGRMRLNQRLSHDPKAQESYLDFCELHAALAWEHGMVITDISPTTCEHTRSAKNALPWTPIAAVMAALAASLSFALIWWSSRDGNMTNNHRYRPNNAGPIVAQLINQIDAVITRNSSFWHVDEFQTGLYELERGLIQLQYESGVTVFIEAPATFEAISSDRLALHSGRISANVPPEGTGFTIETPEADVIDFGTEFSVEVGSGESEVHVFEGHVQVKPRTETPHQQSRSIDLRTDQAIRIADSNRQPVGIDLATDRFIRSIDEPQKGYPRTVRQLEPVAYYRMPIRERGLACIPAQYEGIVLTGTGSRPACAPGIIGASLRVGGKSIGRGGFVENAPPLATGSFALACWIYATGRPVGATVISDLRDHDAGVAYGHFSLSLNERTGMLVATVRDGEDQLINCGDVERMSLEKWHHVAMTCDGNELTLYRNGIVVSSVSCFSLSQSPPTPLSIGVALDGTGVWDGRIDELAIFDKSLSPKEIKTLFQAFPLRNE